MDLHLFLGLELFLSAFYPVYLLIILLIFLISFTNSKKKPKQTKQKHKKIKRDPLENITNIIPTVLDWAKNNSIYINPKIVLNKRTKRDNYFSFYADSKIPNNTLLLRIPYTMMITQKNLYDTYKSIKNSKFEGLWEKVINLNSEYVKYYSTQQLLYMSIILEYAIRKKKGPLYKKYKEYLKLYEQRNMDIYPIFYDQDEKFYLSGSNLGIQINRATEALNEEYILLSTRLNISIPNQDDFFKTRVISLVSSIDFNNSNIYLPSGFNETCIVPFLDCFNKVISAERANTYFEMKGIKNDTNNLTDYYLEIYSSDEIYIGSELNLKWRSFPNTEFLIYYGQVEEGNPFNSKYYIDIINRKLKEDLGFDKEKIEVFDESDPGAVMQRGFDCFAVLGGNSFRLLYNVKRFGLDRFITEQVKNGAVYMGFSAGACITCENIEYLKNLDENNDISDGDFSALGLTDKYVLCHYNLRGMQDIIACRKILGMGTELFTLNDGDIRVL